MASSSESDVFGAALNIIALGLILLIAFVAFWLAVVLGILFLAFKIYQISQNTNQALERKAREQTQALYEQIKALAPTVMNPEEFADTIFDRLPDIDDTALRGAMLDGLLWFYETEDFGRYEPLPPPAICHSIEGAEYRDYLSKFAQRSSTPQLYDLVIDGIVECYRRFLAGIPESKHSNKDINFRVPLDGLLGTRAPELVAAVMAPFFDDDCEQFHVFEAMREKLTRNIFEASDIPYDARHKDTSRLKMPADYKGEDVIFAYLKNTPLLSLFNDASSEVVIPDEARFTHCYIVAPTGTGKTQLLQYLLSHDLQKVINEEASIVVMDSQGELLKTLTSLKLFAKGQPLEDKLIVIGPDLQDAPALNIFDIGRDRLNAYSPNEREKFLNIAVTQLMDVMATVMGDNNIFTPKQEGLFRYMVRLMMAIPNSTMGTFVELLKAETVADLKPYQPYINTLSAAAQEFFADEFPDSRISNGQRKRGQYADTKQQIAWRIANLRENEFLARMFFGHPKSKLDLFSELNSSKVIFVDTNQEYLGTDGTAILGRYFIAALLSASQERASLPASQRQAVYAYLDECHDYISREPKIAVLLDQARKMRISLTLAHQRCRQIKDSNVLDALLSTAIKFASTTNPQDVSQLARAMQTNPEVVAEQPNAHFALQITRHLEAVSVMVPFGHMEDMARMNEQEQAEVFAGIKARYTTRHKAADTDAPINDDIIYVDDENNDEDIQRDDSGPPTGPKADELSPTNKKSSDPDNPDIAPGPEW
jgi:hypothetical protein